LHGFVEIAVSDTGIGGIDELPRLTERFYRVDKACPASSAAPPRPAIVGLSSSPPRLAVDRERGRPRTTVRPYLLRYAR
jgi:hypothetical protein